LRVDNSSKDGAAKGESENKGLLYVNANGEQAPPELTAQIPTDLEIQDQVQWMLDKGYEVQSSDARILLGDESLRVFMVVDVVRFANDEAAAAAAAAEESGAGDGADEVEKGEK